MQKRHQLSSMLPRQSMGLLGSVDGVPVQVNKDVIVLGQIYPLISALDANDVGAWRLEGRDQSRRQDRDEDACPFEGV